MLTITATFDVTILYFVAANVIAIVAYVLFMKGRARRAQRNIDVITTAMVEFFHKSGEKVSVQCISEQGGKGFVALIDSLPSKRFRHSHIVAVILANHVRTVCGLELARIYWRFPIKPVREETTAQRTVTDVLKLFNDTDDYLAEGRLRFNDLPQYEVTESSWDKFEEVVHHEESVC